MVQTYPICNQDFRTFQGEGVPQTTCPALNPEAQAHWKLYPPSHPVTSTTSPMKYSPGTFGSASSSHPAPPCPRPRPSPQPWHTPRSPPESPASACSPRSIAANELFVQSAGSFKATHRSAIRPGSTARKACTAAPASRRAFRSSSGAVTEAPGAISISTASPGRQYDETCKIAGPLNPRCVTSIFSRKLPRRFATPAVATTSVETPERSHHRSRSASLKTSGTNPGLHSTIRNPNCSATHTQTQWPPSSESKAHP